MKKTSFALALFALLFTTLSAESCSKTTLPKGQTVIAIASPPAEKMPEKSEVKTVETTVEKTAEKSTPIVADKPEIAKMDTAKTTAAPTTMVETIGTKSVATDTALKQMPTTVTTTQVIDNTPVTTEKPIVQVVKKADFDHSTWNDLLKKHVSSTGKVDYKGFKRDIDILDTYMRSLNEGAPAETASKEERLSYWINAYNAVTVRLIVNNYPISSITKLDAGKPWDVKRYSNGGKKMSLNDIENNILRPMGDARIHFALNCAAKSCPPLLNEAFTADNVNKLLEQRTRQFVNSSRTVIEKDAVKVSKVFDWYGKDFGNVVDFVNKYAKVKAAKTAKVTFADYDWSLND
jgi:hypothetical protein